MTNPIYATLFNIFAGVYMKYKNKWITLMFFMYNIIHTDMHFVPLLVQVNKTCTYPTGFIA